MATDSDVPKLDSLFRIQTLILLQQPKSGYDLAKELEAMTGKKPSSGKIYPFLHELYEKGYIDEVHDADDDNTSERAKTQYILLPSGEKLVEELMERMRNILDARLEHVLESCHHCGVMLYDAKVERVVDGKTQTFCCEHCMNAYKG